MGDASSRFFQELDKNKNGRLDPRELMMLAKAMPWEGRLYELVKLLDKDKDGNVSAAEFKEGIKECKISEAHIKSMRERLAVMKAKGETFDSDDEDEIVTAELATFLDEPEEENKAKERTAPAIVRASLDDFLDSPKKSDGGGGTVAAPQLEEVAPTPGKKKSIAIEVVDKAKGETKGTDAAAKDPTEETEEKKSKPSVKSSFMASPKLTPKLRAQSEVQSEVSASSAPVKAEAAGSATAAAVVTATAPTQLKKFAATDAKNSDAPSYKAGDKVHVWSMKNQKWFPDGNVVAVRKDGSVKVKYNWTSLFAKGVKWIEPSQLGVVLRPIVETPPKTTPTVDRGYSGSDLGSKDERSESVPEESGSKNSVTAAMGAAAAAVAAGAVAVAGGVAAAAHAVADVASKPPSTPAPAAPSSPPPAAPVAAAAGASKAEDGAPPAAESQASAPEPRSMMTTMAEIQDLLPSDSKLSILSEGRILLKHGPVLRKAIFGSSDGYLFLFNDMLLHCNTIASEASLSRTSGQRSQRQSCASDTSLSRTSGRRSQRQSSAGSRSSARVSAGQAAGAIVPPIAEEEDSLEAGGIAPLPSGLKVTVKETFRLENIAVSQGAASGVFGKSFKYGFSIIGSPYGPKMEPVPFGIPGHKAEETNWCRALAGAMYKAHDAQDKKAAEEYKAAKAAATEEAGSDGGGDKKDNVDSQETKQGKRPKRKTYAWSSQLWQGTLHSAAYTGDYSAFKSLAGANGFSAEDIDATEPGDLATPLLTAVARGHLKIVLACADAKANLEATDRSGRFPLALAYARRRLDIFKALLQNGADPNRRALDGRSFFFTEITRPPGSADPQDKCNWIKALVDAKGKPIAMEMDTWGNSVLHLALSRAAEDGWGKVAVEWLIKACPADCKRRNKDGESPLHLAAKRGDVALVEQLLGAGAYPNLRVPRTGKLPLQCTRRPTVAAALLKGGARSGLVDKRGKPALDFDLVARGKAHMKKMLYDSEHFFSHLKDVPVANDITVKFPPPPKPRTECAFCWDKFGLTKWRHQCERCGREVCKACSAHYVHVPPPAESGGDKGRLSAGKKRVCDGCYNFCRVRAMGAARAWGRAQRKSMYQLGDNKRKELLGDDADGAEGSKSGMASGASNQMNQNLQKVKERGEKLRQTEDATADMANEAQGFALLAKKLRQQRQTSWF
mmetsp:Transcript_21589/g.38300  ORF Transcript_21589/g.38300 Transcript_21589/m.38300 type:complete len:1182 (-) Transcript_21589:292-3837(-)